MRAGFRVSNGWCTWWVLGHIINLDVRAGGFRVCVEHEGQTKQHIRQRSFVSLFLSLRTQPKAPLPNKKNFLKS